MKVVRIVILFLIVSGSVSAQKKTNAYGYKFDKQLEFAIDQVFIGDYKSAYNNLLELYQIDSTNIELNYYLGLSSYYANRNKNIALPYLEKGVSFNCNAYFLMGAIYHGNQAFDQALTSYNLYKNSPIDQKTYSPVDVREAIEKINTARKLIESKVSYKVDNMGADINTAFPDYAPIIFANGNKMYFTSRRKGSYPDIKDPNNEYFEDIYYTEKVNGTWQEPLNLGDPINSKTHDASLGVSQNADTLYIYRTNQSLIGGDILYSVKQNDTWTAPIPFASSINTKKGSESSISICSKCEKIYFSSNREGGYGGKDLYYVQKLPNGKWSLPINLGGMINTEKDEDGPFIDSDGTTLYFSSKGHENMGGFDLFKTVLNDDKQWSEPENLGYPINSVKDDIFISTQNNEDYFFSSNRDGGFGFADIYHTYFPKDKNDYVIIKGLIVKPENKAFVRAKITAFKTNSNQVEGIYKPDKTSGKFIMALKPGETYKIQLKSRGYRSIIDTIDLSKVSALEELQKTYRLEVQTTSTNTSDE